MLRMFAGFVLPLAVLALLSPGKTVAGPPEGVSGKMMLAADKVEEALRRYYATKNADTRAERLRTLPDIHDSRILSTLGDALNDREQVVRFEAARLIVARLCNSSGDEGEIVPTERLVLTAKELWRQHQRDHEFAAEKARRRAEQLPQ